MAEKLSVLNKIYYKLPVCLQNVMCGIKGYLVNKRRYNKKFYQYLKLYENKNVIPVDELETFFAGSKECSHFMKNYFVNVVLILMEKIFMKSYRSYRYCQKMM